MTNVFLSHASVDRDVANWIKHAIEASSPETIEVFCSTDDIPLGARWLDVLDEALNEACLFLVLCGPKSVSRPWVNFESGCGWGRRVPVIPICHSGQRTDSLPQPLGLLQGLELDDPRFLIALLRGIGDALGVSQTMSPPPDIVVDHLEIRIDGARGAQELILIRPELEKFLASDPQNKRAAKLLSEVQRSIGAPRWGF